MEQEMIQIPKREYNELKKKAALDEDLLLKLIRGLEDIRLGRIKPWKKTTTTQDNFFLHFLLNLLSSVTR